MKRFVLCVLVAVCLLCGFASHSMASGRGNVGAGSHVGNRNIVVNGRFFNSGYGYGYGYGSYYTPSAALLLPTYGYGLADPTLTYGSYGATLSSAQLLLLQQRALYLHNLRLHGFRR